MQTKGHFYGFSKIISFLFLSFTLLGTFSTSWGNDRPKEFPASAANLLREALSNQTKMPQGKLQLVEAVKETWPDSCLGLSVPGEFCSQELIDGWKVVFFDGNRQWIYHTNMDGKTYRLAQAPV